MKPVGITLFLAAFLATLSAQVAPQQEPTESISGTVTQLDTHAPLAQARVELVRESYIRLPTGHEKPCKPGTDTETTYARRVVTSDVNGRFTFTGVVPGKYYLFAQHEGFLKQAWGQQGRFP